MRRLETIPLLFAVFLLAALVPAARADLRNRDTFLTFSQPVEIPGRVLVPGRYEFKYLGSPAASGDVVAIYDNKGNLIETVLTEPVYRTRLTDHTVVTFAERGNKSPKAIETWFYPDTQNGVQFLYPHSRKME